MSENEIHSIEDYRDQIARVRNAFSVMQVTLNAQIDAAMAELDELKNEVKEDAELS